MSLLNSIRQQIQQGDLELALDRLQGYLRATASAQLNEVILQTARYNRLRREERKGVITQEAARVEESRLVDALLQLLDILEPTASKGETLPPVAPTVETLIPKEVKLEKILGVNNLKQIAWLQRGLRMADSICRVISAGGYGSGFLIAPNLVMTNQHVIPSQAVAAQIVIEFNYQLNLDQEEKVTHRYHLNPSRFQTSKLLDYTIVGIAVEPGQPDLGQWGHVTLNPYADPAPGEHVSIIQHPNGGPKQIVLTANQVVSTWEHRLHYTTDTMPGSSGSPVFNDSWEVIAIHHAGGDLQVNAQGDTRFINEGVLMSAIKADAGALWPGG